MVPSSAAALSRSRSEVEPTATMRPPRFRASLSEVRSLGGHLAPFRVHLVVDGVVDLDRQEGAGADMQRHTMQSDTARASSALKSSDVKCKPAVGAATAPSFTANNV